MSKKNEADYTYAAMMGSVVGQVGCLNILVICLSLAAGLFIDKLVGTSGLFAAIFILASVPLSLFLTMRVSLKAISRAQEAAEREAQKKNDPEETEKT